MNDCQFCLSTAPLDKRGTMSNPASIPIVTNCGSNKTSARNGLLGGFIITGRNCYQTAKNPRSGVMSKDEMLRR